MAGTGVSVVVGRHGGGRTRATRDTVGGVPWATVKQRDIVVVERGKVGSLGGVKEQEVEDGLELGELRVGVAYEPMEGKGRGAPAKH